MRESFAGWTFAGRRCGHNTRRARGKAGADAGAHGIARNLRHGGTEYGANGSGGYSLHLQRLNKKKINVLYCYSQVCHLAATAAVEFAKTRLSGHGALT